MSLAPFLPEQSFVVENREAINAVFTQLSRDFPERTVTLEGRSYRTEKALQITEGHELSPAARQWLLAHTVGTQHGYDRPNDRIKKIPIDNRDPVYMQRLQQVNFGLHNLVDGGRADVTVSERNILVGGGFPHLAPSRLLYAVDNDHSLLWDAQSITILTGQRRRWNNNPYEADAGKVMRGIIYATGINTASRSGQRALQKWASQSPFARSQAQSLRNEGRDWLQAYATEAEMCRAAAELALLRSPGLFDWNDYKVKVHKDLLDEETSFGNYRIPARRIKAWEYHLENDRSFFVINGKAVSRGHGEPRPTSASVMSEAVPLLSDNLRSYESVIAFGAPHIRAGIHTAIQIIKGMDGKVKPLHLSNAPWEFHEPPVTGIASILGIETVDTQLRTLVARHERSSQ